MTLQRICSVLLLLLAGCGEREGIRYHAEADPQDLAEWGVLALEDGRLQVSPDALSFTLNTGLFSDYAHKLRTIALPPGTSADYSATDVFALPVGTVLTKTFYYPRESGGDRLRTVSADRLSERSRELDLAKVRVIETRVLVRRESGWAALPYVWNEAQTRATLARTGETMTLSVRDARGDHEFTYVVPDVNQCASCHATNVKTRLLQPIGLAARHLDDGETLERWQARGWLRGLPGDSAVRPRNAMFDSAAPLDARARAYLDIQCGHCHRADGPADTSGLVLDATAVLDQRMGLCKSPIAAGRGTGDRRFGIVPGAPDASILLHRMESTDPAVQMPELGRTLRHDEGIALIREWIGRMTPLGCT